jgi:sec-independent protein translocase protein TatC
MADGKKIHHEEDEELAEGTLVSHLIELRQRLIWATAAIFVIFIGLLPFQTQVFEIVARPIADTLPEGATLIATGTMSAFFTPLKTTFYAALFIAMPVVLYQAWQFVAPGLYRREKRFAMPLVLSSIVLFYTGIAFAYFIVFKIVFGFIFTHAPDNVLLAPDINDYLNFVLRMTLAFGLAFEVPIATYMLVWSRLVTVQTLGKIRPYVFLGAFVVGMFMTPPDMFSQTMLAIPIYLLYESGIILSRIMLPDRVREGAVRKQDEAGGET